MALVRPAARKCDDCSHLDRDTYKGVKANVCYLIEKKDDKPVAVIVTSKTPTCQHYNTMMVSRNSRYGGIRQAVNLWR